MKESVQARRLVLYAGRRKVRNDYLNVAKKDIKNITPTLPFPLRRGRVKVGGPKGTACEVL